MGSAYAATAIETARNFDVIDVTPITNVAFYVVFGMVKQIGGVYDCLDTLAATCTPVKTFNIIAFLKCYFINR